MRIKFSRLYGQAFNILIISFLFYSGCNRTNEEIPVAPPVTHPLLREYIGFGVVNVSFTHLLDDPNPRGNSQGYLRRGTLVRIIERKSIINRGVAVSWVLAEGNYQNSGVNSASGGIDNGLRGWLEEQYLDIYDNESRAKTASETLGP